MTLDDLKSQWTDLDRKLQANIRLNAQLLREQHLQNARSLLRPLIRLIVIEMLMNVVAVVLLGAFMASHIEPRFLAPAIVLDLCAIGLIVAGGRQLGALSSIDYSAPVLAIQRKLETLRAQRIRTVQWTLLLAPLLWPPLLIVTLEGAFGVNPYEALNAEWLTVNVYFGMAMTLLLLWVSTQFADRWQSSTLLRRLMDDIAGRSLNKAAAFLASLSRFEQEEDR
jgi:hypothetical protein